MNFLCLSYKYQHICCTFVVSTIVSNFIRMLVRDLAGVFISKKADELRVVDFRLKYGTNLCLINTLGDKLKKKHFKNFERTICSTHLLKYV